MPSKFDRALSRHLLQEGGIELLPEESLNDAAVVACAECFENEGLRVNGGGIMHHAERSGGPVAAAQNCATHGRLLVMARGRRCTAWSSMRRFDWRLSTRG